MTERVLIREPASRVVIDDETDAVVVEGEGAQGPPGAAGPAGPPGATGASGGSYRHVQGVAATTWTVVHNLGYFPGGITAYENLGGGVFDEIEGEIDHLSMNSFTVTFNAAVSGECHVS